MPRRIKVEAASPALPGGADLACYPVVEELVRLDLDGVSTVVAVIRPNAPGPFPVLVFHHGAGTGNHTAFREHGMALAAWGVGCVTPDKDLTAYSFWRRDYDHMARQYAELAGWVRRQPWADPARTGHYGESEGAWTARLTVALDPTTSLLALVSDPGVTPRCQAYYAASTYLMSVSAPAPLFDAAVRLVGAKMPPGLLQHGDFQVACGAEVLRMPVFVAYGTNDISMPLEQGALAVLDQAGGPVLVRYYAGANHGLRVGPDQRLAPDFLRDLAIWANQAGSAALAEVPRVAGDQPEQAFWADQPPAGVPITYLVGTLGLALGAVGVSYARREGPPGRRRSFNLFRFGALASFGGYVTYMQKVVNLAVSYHQAPGLIHLGYRAVQASGLVTVGAGLHALRRTKWRPGRLAAGLVGGGLLAVLTGYLGAFGRLKVVTPPKGESAAPPKPASVDNQV